MNKKTILIIFTTVLINILIILGIVFCFKNYTDIGHGSAKIIESRKGYKVLEDTKYGFTYKYSYGLGSEIILDGSSFYIPLPYSSDNYEEKYMDYLYKTCQPKLNDLEKQYNVIILHDTSDFCKIITLKELNNKDLEWAESMFKEIIKIFNEADKEKILKKSHSSSIIFMYKNGSSNIIPYENTSVNTKKEIEYIRYYFKGNEYSVEFQNFN